jgi:predicted phage-related endonuclease
MRKQYYITCRNFGQEKRLCVEQELIIMIINGAYKYWNAILLALSVH